MVSGGCIIDGKVDFSVLFSNVTVEKGASVEYSIIMPGAVIKKGAKVRYAMVAENAVIEENAVVGEAPEEIKDLEKWGVTVIGADITIGKKAKIAATLMIDENIKEGEVR